jgi:hypothetical protein
VASRLKGGVLNRGQQTTNSAIFVKYSHLSVSGTYIVDLTD